MSQTPRDEREARLAEALRQALENPARPLSEPEPALSEALGAALFLRHSQRPPLLGPDSLAALAREIEAEAQNQLAREEEAAEALAQALEHPAAELDHEEAASALGAALFLRHAKEAPTLGASFLAELGHSLQQAVQAEPDATARERRIAESLRAQIADQVPSRSGSALSAEHASSRANLAGEFQTTGAHSAEHSSSRTNLAGTNSSGSALSAEHASSRTNLAGEFQTTGAHSAEPNAPALLRLHGARTSNPAAQNRASQALSLSAQDRASHGAALSDEEAQAASKALGTALFLRHVQEAPRLSREALAALAREVETEAKARSRRRQRFALLSGASALALAASLLLLLRPPAPRAALPEANFPTPPRLTQEFKPGSDPLTRLDPLYEAGLRGMREARFVGAHYANAEK